MIAAVESKDVEAASKLIEKAESIQDLKLPPSANLSLAGGYLLVGDTDKALETYLELTKQQLPPPDMQQSAIKLGEKLLVEAGSREKLQIEAYIKKLRN